MNILYKLGDVVMSSVIKHPGDQIRVSITVKNTGTAKGTWGLDFDFEDDVTIRIPKSERKVVTLNPGESKTVSWTVYAPDVYGTTRLVVYWSDEGRPDEDVYPHNKAMDWWVTIKSRGSPNLSISGSNVS